MMRRQERRITDTGAMHAIIQAARVGRLGLCDGERPYVVPLCFGFDGQHLYFHSAPAGTKVAILSRNSRVCVEFEGPFEPRPAARPCGWSLAYASVVCHGTAAPVSDPAAKAYGLGVIMRQFDRDAADYRYTEQELAGVAVYRVTIEAMVGKANQPK